MRKLFILGAIVFSLSQCYTADYYRLKVFEIFCKDCGDPDIDCKNVFLNHKTIQETHLELPVGDFKSERYYIAQGFSERNAKFRNRYHLGEDWNYVGGGDSDFGAPVYSIGNGIVSMTKDLGGGWGKVIRICHQLSQVSSSRIGYEYIESIYAHLSEFHIRTGDIVERGRWIGAIGNSNQAYASHLHFELRSSWGEDLGGGYDSEIPNFFLNPSRIIQSLSKSK